MPGSSATRCSAVAAGGATRALTSMSNKIATKTLMVRRSVRAGQRRSQSPRDAALYSPRQRQPGGVMHRRDFLAAAAATLTLPLSKLSGAAAAERRLLYVAEPGIRNYVRYGGIGVLVYD